jgi:inner membrane protein
MENLTHTLIGFTLSRAGLNRWSPRPDLTLMLAANIPDIDMLCWFGGPLTLLQVHRGHTHSFAMLPVMALVATLIVCAVSRSTRGWKATYALSLVGVASHLLLDWTNTYGIRLLLPFSGEWLHLDLNHLFDFWILAALLIVFFGSLLGKLVSGEIGAGPTSGRALAICALAFVVVYDSARLVLHQRAIDALESRVYEGSPARRTGAFPGPANPFRWNAWVQASGFARRYELNLNSEFDPTSGKTFYDSEPSPALDAARATEPFQRLLAFSQYPLWITLPAADPDAGVRIELTDWRFNFKAIAIVDRGNRVQRSWFQFGR